MNVITIQGKTGLAPKQFCGKIFHKLDPPAPHQARGKQETMEGGGMDVGKRFLIPDEVSMGGSFQLCFEENEEKTCFF